MSLDVYLIKNFQDNEIETYSKVELNHLYVNFSISQEKGYSGSFENFITSLPDGWRKVANRDNPDYKQPNEELYWANITHNLGNMADKAGIYEALWRPYKLRTNCPENNYDAEDKFEVENQIRAEEIIPILKKGLDDLKTRPEYFKQFNSPNGWGMYEHFVPFVEKYLKACKKYPNATIVISR